MNAERHDSKHVEAVLNGKPVKLKRLEFIEPTPADSPVMSDSQAHGDVDGNQVFHRGWGLPSDRRPDPIAEGHTDHSPG